MPDLLFPGFREVTESETLFPGFREVPTDEWGQKVEALGMQVGTAEVPPTPAVPSEDRASRWSAITGIESDWGRGVNPEKTPEEVSAKHVRRLQFQAALTDPSTSREEKRSLKLQMSVDTAKERYANMGEDMRYWTERMPFVGAAGQAADYAAIYQASQRIKADKGTEADYETVADFLARSEYQKRDKGFWKTVGDIASAIPGSGIEFASTGGLMVAGRKGGEKLAGKVTQNRLAKWLAGAAAGTAAQAAGMPQRIAASAMERKAVASIMDEDDPGFVKALGLGYLDTAVSVGTEYSGGILAKLPIPKRLRTMKEAIVGRWLSKGKTMEALQGTLRKAGWHSVLGEVFEERAEEIVRGATGLSQGYGTTGQILSGEAEGWKQIGREATAFMVPGLAARAGGITGNILDRIRVRVDSGGAPSRSEAQDLGIPPTEAQTAKGRRGWFSAHLEQLKAEYGRTRQGPTRTEEPGAGVLQPDRAGEAVQPAVEEAVRPTEVLPPEVSPTREAIPPATGPEPAGREAERAPVDQGEAVVGQPKDRAAAARVEVPFANLLTPEVQKAIRQKTSRFKRDFRDDYFQEGVLKVQKAYEAGEYDPARPFQPWAAEVAKKAMLDARPRIEGRQPEGAPVAERGQEAPPMAAMEAAEEAGIAQKAVDALENPVDREILNQKAQGKSNTAIAKSLGISPQYVGQQLKTARAKVKTGIGEIAAQARAEAAETMKAFGRRLKSGAYGNPFLDAELVGLAGKIVYQYGKAGVWTFAEFMVEMVGEFGDAAKRIEAVFAKKWDEYQITKSPEIASTKFRIMDELRAARGEEPTPRGPRGTFEGWLAEAAEKIAVDPRAPDVLVDSLLKESRSVTAADEAMLQLANRRAENTLGETVSALTAARQSGDAAKIAVAQIATDVALQRLQQIEEAAGRSGTISGQALVARKIELNRDESLAGLTRRAVAAKGGEALTADEATDLTRKAEEIDRRKREARVSEEIGKDREETKQRKSKPKQERKAPPKPEDIKRPTATDLDSLGRFARQLRRALVEAGIWDREKVIDLIHKELQTIVPDITRREAMDAMSGYGVYSPLSKEAARVREREISGEAQQLAKLDDMLKGQAPKKTGVERRTPSDEERQLIAQVNEAKKRGGFTVTDPETQLKSALDAAKIAVQHRIADLEQEISTRKKIVNERTPLKADAALTKLRERRDELLKAWKEVFPKKPLTPEQRIAAAGNTMDRMIATLEADLKAGKLWKETPKRPEFPELEVKRTRLAELQQIREVLRSAADPNRDYRRYLDRELERVQERIAEEDFGPRERKQRTLDKQTLNARWELEKARTEFRQKQKKWQWGQKSLIEKSAVITGRVLNVTRSILTSLDVSAVLRQGAFVVYGHPWIATKALPEMFRAFWSKKSAFAAAEQIRNRPRAKFYEQIDLDLTDPGGGLSHQEEAYIGEWTRHIPGVAGSERAYVTYLNRIRADVTDSMVSTLESRGGITIPEGKVIANYVNVVTGRGDLGKFKQAAVPLATVFFSPRFAISRFQLLAGQPLWRGNVRTKAVVAREYARSLMGLGVFYGTVMLAGSLLSGDDKDRPVFCWDWRSPDFGKIRMGDTIIDPLAGISQTAVLIGRLITGKAKIEGGGTVPFTGSDVPYGGKDLRSVFSDFMYRKLAPVPGAALNLTFRTDAMNQPVTLGSTAKNLLVPIGFSDVFEAMRAQGVPKGSAMGLLAIFGMGVQSRGTLTEDQIAKAAHTLSGPKDSRKITPVDQAYMDRAKAVLRRSGKSETEIRLLLRQHLIKQGIHTEGRGDQDFRLRRRLR